MAQTALGIGDRPVAASPQVRERRDWLPFWLSLPAQLVVFLVIGLPVVYSLALSLHPINMLTKTWVFVGLQKYLEILPDPEFLWALGRTAYFAGFTVAAGLALGLAMALVLNMAFPGRGLLRSIVLVPWAMAPVTVGVLCGWIFDGSYGALNGLVRDLGIVAKPRQWLGDGTTAFNLVALVHVWNQAPLTALLILSGLQSLSENLHKAARIDGAGAWRRFVSITLPWLRPMLLLILILTTIDSIMAFDLFWMMTRGGPGRATTVFSWMGYAYAFQFMRFAEGAAILSLLTIPCLLLAWLCLRLFFPTVRRVRGEPLDLIDTRTGLIIAYCSLILPLSIWMMKGYFDGLPPNLEKAALVDGCTRLQAIWGIVLPVARPGLVAAGIFCFLVSWNEFIFALILTGTPNAQTILVIIAGFLVQLRFYDYGPMFAASVLAVLPPVLIARLFQRYLVRGMLSGSLKG